MPFLINAFFKLITPFIDPLTRPKLRFNPSCLSEGLFAAPRLIKEWGGDAVVVYEHERYWPALVRMCAERRERMWEVWRARGARVGLRCGRENGRRRERARWHACKRERLAGVSGTEVEAALGGWARSRTDGRGA